MFQRLVSLAHSPSWACAAFGFVLVATAGLLFLISSNSWEVHRSEKLAPAALDFFARQYRRRQRLNGLIALAGVAVWIGPWVLHPVWRLAYWLGVVGIVLWIGLLAVLDFVASYLFLQSVQSDQQATRAAMEAQIRQMRRRVSPDARHPRSNTAIQDRQGEDEPEADP